MKKKNDLTVKIFALASFLNDFGSDMIYPIWPLFVTTVMGADLTVLGLIDGLGDALVSISKAVSGYLSDRIGKRKIFIWTGYVFGGVSRIGYALAPSWQWLIPFKILDRSGKMRGAPRDAIIADVSNKKTRGTNFGLLRTMDNLGAVCGIITTIILINFLELKTLFMIAAIPSLIGAGIIFIMIKDHKTHKIFKGISFKDLDKNFWIFLAASSIFSLGSFSYSFLLIFAKEIQFTVAQIPVLYLLFTAVAALMAIQFGKLADKIGRKPLMILSYLLFAGLCLVSILVKSFLGVVTVFVLYGLHRAAFEPVVKTFVSELSPKKYRASTLGGFQMVTGLLALPASMIAGWLWETHGANAAFSLSLTLSMLATILLFGVKEKI